ncbi:hypothetical protein QBC39DRAFT_416793 [Podospora conica]|nr:hypothetical protein QBC39DRAFT_416793 [Schizothecium conicum]
MDEQDTYLHKQMEPTVQCWVTLPDQPMPINGGNDSDLFYGNAVRLDPVVLPLPTAPNGPKPWFTDATRIREQSSRESTFSRHTSNGYVPWFRPGNRHEPCGAVRLPRNSDGASRTAVTDDSFSRAPARTAEGSHRHDAGGRLSHPDPGSRCLGNRNHSIGTQHPYSWWNAGYMTWLARAMSTHRLLQTTNSSAQPCRVQLRADSFVRTTALRSEELTASSRSSSNMNLSGLKGRDDVEMCICMDHAVAVTTEIQRHDLAPFGNPSPQLRSVEFRLNYAVEWSTEQGCRE